MGPLIAALQAQPDPTARRDLLARATVWAIHTNPQRISGAQFVPSEPGKPLLVSADGPNGKWTIVFPALRSGDDDANLVRQTLQHSLTAPEHTVICAATETFSERAERSAAALNVHLMSIKGVENLAPGWDNCPVLPAAEPPPISESEVTGTSTNTEPEHESGPTVVPPVIRTTAAPNRNKNGKGLKKVASNVAVISTVKGSGRKKLVSAWATDVIVLCLAILAAVIVRTLLFQAFYIPSESMRPTLDTGDRVLVAKWPYHSSDPKRGEIVVFTHPNPEDAEENVVKRVIGLPGEVVEGHGGRVWVDDVPLLEPWLPADTWTAGFEPIVVPNNHVWVLGDNRENSTDSRWFGPIAVKDIIGRAEAVVWPPKRIGGI